MTLWQRIRAACRDQRGQLDIPTDFVSIGSGAPDISQYIPTQMDLSPGQALSLGPVGEQGGGAPGSFLDSLSGYAKNALPFIQAGTGLLGGYAGIKGMQLAGQQQKTLNTAEKTAQQAAAPAIAAGQQLVPAGTQALLGGALPPELESTVNNWANNWRTQLRNYYAKAGITDSTMMAEAEATIQAQAQELRAQLASGLLQGGMGALSPAIQAASVGGGLAANESNAVNTAILAANNSLTKLLGSTG